MTGVLRSIICVLLGCAMVALGGVCQAQQADSLLRQTLREVRVSDAAPSVTRAQTPTQVVTVERIEQSGASQLSDVLRQMAGLTIKDYGGVGGIKTVSARGLGSQFSTLTIDGVAVSDCQNGQVDLGRYMVGNSAFVSFANGQQTNLLQSARGYAAGNVVSMETQTPSFFGDRNTNFKTGIEAGSFGLFSPTMTIDHRFNRRMTLSLYGSHVRSEGEYPFTIFYGKGKGDSTAVHRRENSQMRLTTLDGNLFYSIAPNRQLTLKTHYVAGRHNLPGAVSLYSTTKASEHSEEQLFFMQAKYRHGMLYDDNGRSRLQLQLLGKYQLNEDVYEDTSWRRPVHSDYHQREGYLSGTLLYSPVKWWKISVAEDGALNTLHSSLATNNKVDRLTSLTVLASSVEHRGLSITANVLATLVTEEAYSATTEATRDAFYRRMSPYVGVSWQPLPNVGWRLRYFYKENYRIPTFSEMYFLMVYRLLRPECAEQHNVGMTYVGGHEEGVLRYVAATVDAYHNKVSDKIIAVPASNMFVWSMTNMGLVEINGLEVRTDATLHFVEKWELSLSASYTYQKALDRTQEGTKSYGHQIPYTPRHSGNAAAYLTTPWVDLGYDVVAVGERYSSAQNNEQTRMDGYWEHGLSVGKVLQLPHSRLRLMARVLNLTDVQYEVVRSYPMMGRNYRLSIYLEF